MIINNHEKYDGKLLHSRFAYRYFKDKVLPTGNIIAFKAPMLVEAEGMIDLEDVMNNDFIYSDLAINYCWEIPIINDKYGSVLFQRLFCNSVANILTKYIKAEIEVDGDDFWVLKEHNQGGIIQQRGKASVSIATTVDNCALGHLGINVVAGKKAPAFAYSTNLNTEQCEQFMREVVNCFYGMSHDVFLATTKLTK